MRGQRLLTVTLGVAILVSCCSSIESNSSDASPKESKDGKANRANLRERLSEMAKEFGATSFEETSEEMSSVEESDSQSSLTPKQHVKRLVSAERNVELQEYQGVMGRPGVDFPVLPSIPKTGFSCRQVKSSGYYADLDTDCQVFHICADGRKISFLCPNGTIFRQSHLICDWWWTVDCASSKEHYEESAEMLANDRKIYQARSDALSKSRAQQRGNRKPGIIREFEGTSASITSLSTEPNPRIARIEAHSKVINPSKYFSSSTVKPNQNVFSGTESSKVSVEFQTSGSMEQAEQRQIHANHPPFPETRIRRPVTEGRQTSQSRLPSETRPSVYNIPQLRDFKQNIPPTPRASEQRQFAPSKEFSELQPSTRPTPLSRQPFVTTHSPPNNQFTNFRQLDQNTPERQLSQGRQTSQSRFTSTRQQNQRQSPPPLQNNQRQPQFHPEPQAVPQSTDDNNSQFRSFSSSDGERQLPAETGSFVSNRGNQLIKQTTPKPNKQRITPLPQNKFPQSSNKSYVELDRSRTTTPKPTKKPSEVNISTRAKPIVIQVTDRGLTGLSNKDDKDSTTGHPPADDEGDDGFPEPPSEEQFKDEDLFYLRGTTESVTEEAVGSTENPTKLEDEGEIDLETELGLSKPPNDVQFKVEDFGGLRNNSKYVESAQTMLIPERSTAQSIREDVSDNSGFSSVDISTKKSHRFHTPTTSTSIPSSSTLESQTVPQAFISSTLEPPTWKDFTDEDVVIIKESLKITEKPLMLDDDFHTTTLATITEDVETDEKNKIPSSSISIASSTTVSPPEESTRKRVTPIFLEIISRGSSEEPIFKTFTVEELEKKHEMTESSISTEENPSESLFATPETSTQRRFRSQTTTESITTDSGTQSPSSPVLLSERVHPPKQDNSITSTSPDFDKPTKSTTSIPPTTLYVTLSRRVQPPVLILSSTDPREQNKLKIDEIIPKTKESFRTKTESTEGTTATTISRRVRPPITEDISSVSPINITNSTTAKTGASSREPSESSVSVQALTDDSLQALNIEVDQLPIEDDNSDDLLDTTQSSIIPNSSIRNSTSYAQIQTHKTTTTPSTTSAEPSTRVTFSRKETTTADPVESDNYPSNKSTEIGNSIKDTITVNPYLPQSLPLKQDPTPVPQSGNRDGLDIPVSSGTSTLHSLAVYFATKDNQTETTSPPFDSNTLFDSKNHGENDKTTIASTPLTSSTSQLESTTEKSSKSQENDTDTSVSSLKFLTQSTRNSYSSLFPNTKTEVSSTSEQPEVSITKSTQKASKNKDRNTSESSHEILKTQLLHKLAEISQMESTQPSEGKSTSVHTDTQDLLQGTDSRDLRELAQIFSRALSAYLEDPEEFKKVLNEVRPKEPEPSVTTVSTTLDEIQQQTITVQPFVSSSAGISTSSIDYSSSLQEDDDEVLDFSDVYKVSRKKAKFTTPLPELVKSVKTSKKKDSTPTTSSLPTSTVSTRYLPSQYHSPEQDTELKPPKERLQNAQSSYYSTPRQLASKITSSNDEEIKLVTYNPTEDTVADYTLPPTSKHYTGPEHGPQSGEGNFGPTAGGVNDPSRPRYGGFQNNSKLTKTSKEIEIEAKIDKILDTKAIIEATTLSPGRRIQTRTTLRPRTLKTSENNDKNIKENTHNIEGILNIFVPEDINNLAIVSDVPDVENDQKYRKTDSRETTDESLIGANTASFSSSRVYQSANQVQINKKWDEGAEIIDPLAINRELSASEEIVASVTTTEKPNPIPKEKIITSSVTVTPTSTVQPNSSSEYVLSTSATSPAIKSTEETKLIEADSEEELQPSKIPYITFYSEKIKLPPPSSDSLISVSSRKSNDVSSSSFIADSGTSSENPINVSTSTNRSSQGNESSAIRTLKFSSSYPKFGSKIDSGVNEHNTATSKLSTKSTEVNTDIPAEVSIQYRLSTPMPFIETTESTKSGNVESTVIPQEIISTTNSIPTTLASLVPFSPSSHSSRRTKSTTQSPSFIQGDTEILKNVENRKNAVRILELPTSTVPTQSLENNSSTIVTNLVSKSQNIVISQNMTHEPFIHTSNLTSTKASQDLASAEVKAPLKCSETSRLAESSEVSLNMEDVTSEQLQALEDLQKMIFPENMTVSEDGIFDNLNQSSTLSIINTMKEAVTNSTVRRLVLLLVNNLKENTPEDTRRQLIEALLKMTIDHHSQSAIQDESIIAMLRKSGKSHSVEKGTPVNSADKKSSSKNTNSEVLTKTAQNKQVDTEVKTSVTTQSPFRTRARKTKTTQTTTQPPETTILTVTPGRSKSRRPTRLRTTTQSPHITIPTIRRSSSLEREAEDLATEADTLPQSDTRAVELLRSLYSLASRWG